MRWAGHRHDHVVHFYGDDDELVAGVAEHLAEQPPSAAVVIARPAIREALADQRRRAGLPDVGLELDASAVLSRFMVGDRPDPARFEEVVGGALAGIDTGQGPVQAFGEMVALLWDGGNATGAIELERLWNQLAEEHPIALRCAYPMASIASADDLTATAHLCASHSQVVGPARGAFPTPGALPDRRSRLFVPALSSVRGVRSFVAATLADWDAGERTDDALLVASELATNAIRHAQSPLRVVVSRAADGLTIAVDDTSHVLPVSRVATLGGVGGRGLPIVAALSTRHGAEVTTEGKTVWSTIDRPA